MDTLRLRTIAGDRADPGRSHVFKLMAAADGVVLRAHTRDNPPGVPALGVVANNVQV